MATPEWHRNLSAVTQSSCFPSVHLQAARLNERRDTSAHCREVCGAEFVVMPRVYDTGVDTELMAVAVRVRPGGRFLEVGCGCGALALLLAQRCHDGVGTDINPAAIENAEHNRIRLGISNVQFAVADVFDGVSGQFDVVVCNPPYNRHEAADAVDRMFWDPEDGMKRRFFAEVRTFLRPNGRVFFGWANFPDLDSKLPLALAEQAGLRYVRNYSRPSGKGVHLFLVLEFRQ
jgi:methylase of polypeptide subunit release factors